MIAWLVGWLIGRLVDGLVGWFICWFRSFFMSKVTVEVLHAVHPKSPSPRLAPSLSTATRTGHVTTGSGPTPGRSDPFKVMEMKLY